MMHRNRNRVTFASRALAAWMLALYAAAAAGQAIPTLCIGECEDAHPSVISGLMCCPMGCAVAGHDHHHHAHLPADCDFCSLIMPLCVAAAPPALAIPALPSTAAPAVHETMGYATLWRGPASPRDPPSAA